jgi:hypothetical protein
MAAWTDWQFDCKRSVWNSSLDDYESAVLHYLRSDRALFVNTQFCIQINDGPNPYMSGPHWYCDAVALDFRCKKIFLCEILYATNLDGLIDRMKDWKDHWAGVPMALARDCYHADQWPIAPWLFVPETRVAFLKRRLDEIAPPFEPKITPLEGTHPWFYPSWNREHACKYKPPRPGSLRGIV